MTTKEQERKALEQIKKIIAGLGENSYVGTALDGCLEIAEQNIDFDVAFSMKEKKDLAEKKCNELKQVCDELVEEKKAFKDLSERTLDLLNQKNVTANKYYDSWRKAEDKAIANWNMYREQENKVLELQDEIVRLKAKLYDLICK